MSKLRCNICGGQIEVQADCRGLCLNCDAAYSLVAMRQMFAGKNEMTENCCETIEHYRQLLNRYISAGDYIEAEKTVKKLLEADPSNEMANAQYEQLQVLKFMDVRNSVLKGYSGTASILSIPDIVTAIDPEVFAGNDYLEEITLPDGLTVLRHGLFSKCSKLRCVHIPNSVLTIEDHVFENCGSLSDISIPSNVTHIGSGAFAFCSSLREVDIPASVISIGELGFYTSGNDGAFSFCENLKKVSFCKGLKSIGCYSFRGTALENVELPDGLEDIGELAFADCTTLKRLVIPDSVQDLYESEIARTAWLQKFPWDNCRNLEIVEYPLRFNPDIFQGTKFYVDVIQPQKQREYNVQRWKKVGLCQHCGGSFALFSRTCKSCGRYKDY